MKNIIDENYNKGWIWPGNCDFLEQHAKKWKNIENFIVINIINTSQ